MEAVQFSVEYQELMERMRELDAEWEQLEYETKRPWNAHDTYMLAGLRERIAEVEAEVERIARQLETTRQATRSRQS